MGLKAKWKRGQRCPQQDKRRQSSWSEYNFRDEQMPGTDRVVDGAYGRDLDPAIHKENEQYRARLAGAVRDRLRDVSDAKNDGLDQVIKISVDLARRRFGASLVPDGKGALYLPIEVGDFAYTVAQCVRAMDDPYRINRRPWKSLGFTAEEKVKLEHIIFLRYMAGWFHSDAKADLDRTGETAEETVTRIERELASLPVIRQAGTPHDLHVVLDNPGSEAITMKSEWIGKS